MMIWIRRLIIIIGVPSLLAAAWFAYTDILDLESPPLWALVPAGILNLMALYAGAQSWSAVLPVEVDRRVASNSFYTSQLMKYSPVGGVAQAASQVVLATGDDVTGVKATTAMIVSKLTVVFAGSVFGPVLALSQPDLVLWQRAILMLTPLALLGGTRRFLESLVRVTAKVLRKDLDHAILPDQAGVWRSVLWAIPGLGFSGAAFAILAVASGLGANPIQAAAGFVLAWVIGFLVIPIPAGLGIREAAIAFLVAGDPASTLVAAVLFRLVVVATEGLAAGIIKIHQKIAERRAPSEVDAV